MNNYNNKLIKEFKNKKILISGGTGSIGLNIVRELLNYSPKAIRILSNDEHSIVEAKRKLGSNKRCIFFVGDIRDKDRLNLALRGVDIVFHAAAMKHVDVCEENPFDAIRTNVVGTSNILEASLLENISKFILISTDKAVNPVSTLGASKLLAEKLTINAGKYRGTGKTIFSIVRFGNVLGSSGSVFEIFQRKLESNEDIFVTDPNMSRFVMSIKNSVDMILRVTSICKDGEIFILKMPSVKIETLAKEMIEFVKNSSQNKYSGTMKIGRIKTGEKINESLITDNEIEFCHEVDGMYKITKEKNRKKISPNYFNSDSAKRIERKLLVNMIKDCFTKKN